MGDPFHAALNALFGHDPGAQAHANTWLAHYATTHEAWAGCVGLLEPSTPPQVAFFAANMLLSKTRSEWGSLGQDQREQLRGVVG
jgi:hypothetical protein